MAALSNADIDGVSAKYMAEAGQTRQAIPVNKAALRAAFVATDAWIDANAAAFNAALPLPARTALSTQQKLDLFTRVARRRFEVG